MNENRKCINATVKQDIVHVNNDKRDLVTANHQFITNGKGGTEFTQAYILDKALDWYLSECNTKDGRIVIPIYTITFVHEEDGIQRRKCEAASKALKYVDYSKIQRVRQLWQSVNPIAFVQAGPDIGRGVDISSWLDDEDIIFSIWLYAYENGVIADSYVIDFNKHGKNMGTGWYYVRLIEVGIYKPSGYYEIALGGRVYSISSGQGFGSQCRGQNFLHSVEQNYVQENNMDSQEYQFDYPEIGD